MQFKHLHNLYDKIRIIIYLCRLGVKNVGIKSTMWSDINLIYNSAFFDADYYASVCGHKQNKKYLAIHYLYVGYKVLLEPSMQFSGKAYYACYPDIEKTGMCPLLHYEKYGLAEGRIVLSQQELKDNTISHSEYEYLLATHKRNKIVLLVSHEMSLTGAPRALLNLAITLRELGVSSIIWSLLPGDLQKEASAHGIPCKVCPLLISSLSDEHVDNNETKKYVSLFNLIVFNTIVVLPLIKSFKSIPVKKICWIHDGAYGFNCHSDVRNFHTFYQMCDSIFVVGDYAKHIAQSYADGNLRMNNLIYGISDDAIANHGENVENEKVTMVLAGTIDRRKGQDILLDALDLLAPDIIKQLDIKIIGNIIDDNIGKRLLTTESGCISVLGPKPHDELLKEFEKMDILLCPSIDDPMPIVCTEAMMLSKPVIVSNHTGTASFIQEGVNGFVVEAGLPQALAKGIEKAVKSRKELKQLGQQARHIFEKNFTNEIFKENVRNLIFPML